MSTSTSKENKSLTFKFYGTRGSMPICHSSSIKYGGNTTCMRVISSLCIPEDEALIIDAGTGIYSLSKELLGTKMPKKINICFTHWHHDHTQGLFLCPFLFMKHIPLMLYGPTIDSLNGPANGPIEMIKRLMIPPYFPVHYGMVLSHVTDRGFKYPAARVILFHKIGGSTIMNIDDFENIVSETDFNIGDPQISFGEKKFPLNECLQINMFRSDHPEHTISYRFFERPTGKVGVFFTDHENQDGIPKDLKSYLKDADFVAIDCQYTRAMYDSHTAGFGHGTPDYCAKLAKAVSIKRLGLTHHDPSATDDFIENTILKEVKNLLEGSGIETFAVADYQEVVV